MLLLQPRQNKVVDLISHPGRIPDCGHGRPLRRLESPVIPSARFVRGCSRCPRGILFDPLAENRDLFVLETTARRHLEVGGLLDGADEQTLVRSPEFHRSSTIASSQSAVPAIQRETAGARALVVARLAIGF